MTTSNIFKHFLKQKVVVVYNNKGQTMKGLLEVIDNKKGFILVKGDYTSKIISFKDINEIKEVRND